MTRKSLPPGAWPSPLSARLIAEAGLRLAQPAIVAGDVLWLEGRAQESGRTVLVRRNGEGQHEDLTPAPFNVRSGAQEYGGGVWCQFKNQVCFVDYRDHRIYILTPGRAPQPITVASSRRFADLCADPTRHRLLAVSEDHCDPDAVANSLVAIDLDKGAVQTLARGADFYSSPCLDQRSQRLAWLQWNHPDMPWDAAELRVADDAGAADLLASRHVAGGKGESVFQPQWGTDGRLYFMSDRSGWWNLHCWDGRQVTPLMTEQADCGFGQWVFGMRSWGFVGSNTVLCCGARDGFWSLALVDLDDQSCRWLDLPFNTVEHVSTAEGRAVLVAATSSLSMSIIDLDTSTLRWQVLQSSSNARIDAACLSHAQPLRYPTSGGNFAHGFYYPPADVGLLDAGSSPPLLVKCHGGPSAHTDAGLDLRIQYWTSRGFAVLDVNYRGSTGFGRAYREALYGNWGVADVEDAIYGARYLAAQGLANPEQLAISGGSAGGFTVLSALTFHDTFSAGASLYGVSDLQSLLNDTHKFEAHYLDRLIGPWPASRALYDARSPLRNADQLASPVLFLQGLRDKVVTPDQSERMAAALRDKGLPVLYITFAEEGHGFRQAENIVTALEAELYFYSRVFGFEAHGIEFRQPIENLDNE